MGNRTLAVGASHMNCGIVAVRVAEQFVESHACAEPRLVGSSTLALKCRVL